MSNKELNKNKLWFILIPILFIAIIIRFVVFYFRTDGFSGISIIIPVLILGVIIFAFITSGCFAAWVYEDCKKRNDDGALWAIIVFITTPFIGLLLYFLRRSDIKQNCLSCGHGISIKAKYCEECGAPVNHERNLTMEKKTHHIKYIVSGTIFLTFMIICLVSFIISITIGGHVNTSVASGENVWNMGIIKMSFETNMNGTWKLNFKSASDGFIKEHNMKIEDKSKEVLYADIHCDTIPENASLTLWLVQGDKAKSINVTNLKEPIKYELNEFENGKLHVRLQINGVEDVSSEIYIK